MGRVRLLSLPRFSHWARLWPFALSSIRLNAAHSNAMTQSSSKKNYRKFFPKLVSYHRFVELMPYTAMLLALFAQSVGLQSLCTGISFVDTTMLDVCDSHRICQNKVFKGVGKEGKAPRAGIMASSSTLSSMTVGKFCTFAWHSPMWTTAIKKFWKAWQKNCLRGSWTKAWSWSLNRKRTLKNQGCCTLQIDFCYESEPWSSR